MNTGTSFLSIKPVNKTNSTFEFSQMTIETSEGSENQKKKKRTAAITQSHTEYDRCFELCIKKYTFSGKRNA